MFKMIVFKVQLFMWFLELISRYYLIQIYWGFQTGSLAQFLRKTSFMCSYSLAAYAEQIVLELKLQFTISLKFHITLKAIPSKFWFILWSSAVRTRKADVPVLSQPPPHGRNAEVWTVFGLVWAEMREGGEGQYYSEIKLLDSDAFKQKMKTAPIKLRNSVQKAFLQ